MTKSESAPRSNRTTDGETVGSPLDQEIEGSDPSSSANTTTCVASRRPSGIRAWSSAIQSRSYASGAGGRVLVTAFHRDQGGGLGIGIARSTHAGRTPHGRAIRKIASGRDSARDNFLRRVTVDYSTPRWPTMAWRRSTRSTLRFAAYGTGTRPPSAKSGLAIAESRRFSRLGRGGRGLACSAKGAPQTRPHTAERPRVNVGTRKLATVVARVG